MVTRLEPEEPDEDLIYMEPAAAAAADDLGSIASALSERFTKDFIYTRIGQSHLVAVNPWKTLESCADSVVKIYASAFKEGLERDPHAFELAAHTYYEMMWTKRDQSIVVL